MMQRLLKAIATLGVLVVLFFLDSKHFKPRALLVVLFILTISYGISLSFSTDLPAHRRWSIGYLVFVGITYLIAGILGFLPHGGLVESMLWYGLISPYPLLASLGQCLFRSPCAVSKLPYQILPLSDHHLFSAITIVTSLIAIVAAAAMPRGNRIGYRVWLALVCLSIAAVLVYALADFESWGTLLHPAFPSSVTTVAFIWAASYFAAYVIARKGVELGKTSNDQSR